MSSQGFDFSFSVGNVRYCLKKTFCLSSDGLFSVFPHLITVINSEL